MIFATRSRSLMPQVLLSPQDRSETDMAPDDVPLVPEERPIRVADGAGAGEPFHEEVSS